MGAGRPGPEADSGGPAPGAPQGFRLPPAARVRRSGDIRSLFRRGKRRRTAHLDVFFRSSPASRSRIGWVVPRHRHGIVERNRLKRRIREIGRTEVLPRLHGSGRNLDVLFRARREAYEARFEELRREMVDVTEALG